MVDFVFIEMSRDSSYSIVQASDVQLTGHSLELYQFVISVQFLQALCKSVDLLHAVIGHT